MAVLNQKLLREDVKKFLHIYADAYTRDAQYELTKKAKDAIHKFYDDYGPNNGEPWYYIRTDDLKRNSYKPYRHQNGRKYYGGVIITSEDMSPYREGTKNETDPFEVASFAWNGWHGHPIRKIYTDSPLEMVKEYAKDEKLLKKLQENAKRVAREENYNYLKF